MSTGKKVLNIFGIVVAIPVNTLLIALLIIAPLLFSLISFTQPKNLADTISNVDVGEMISEIAAVPEGETVPAEMEQIGDFMKTDAAKELMEIYTTDIANALSGSADEVGFTPEKFMEVVDANIDELADVFKDANPEMAELPQDELESSVREMFDGLAEDVVSALPAPQDIKTQIAGDSEDANAALEILGKLNTIKWAFIGVIVILSGLVFALRLYKFRGVCWLAVDLMVAAILSGIVRWVFLSIPTLLSDLAEGSAVISSLLDTVASGFATGMLIRTIIMFVCGVGMLVAYIFIRKALRAKTAPAAVEASAAQEQE